MSRPDILARPAAFGSTKLARGFRRGATLLEMSIWLLIFVGIVGSTLMIASSVLSQNTAATETQTVTTLSSEARKLRTSQGYTATIVEDMCTMGAVPQSVVNPTPNCSGASLINSWGGNITISQIDGGANFAIHYTNIPKQECMSLVNSVKAGVLQSVGPNTAANTNIITLTPSMIDQTICSDAGNNDVTWSTKVQS